MGGLVRTVKDFVGLRGTSSRFGGFRGVGGGTLKYSATSSADCKEEA